MSVQLYTHSDYSLLESVLSVEELVQRAAQLGIEALALTDHNTTAGHFELEQHCLKYGIKPIFGLELDVSYSDTDEFSQLVALSLTSEGYGNLLHLASLPTPVDYKMLPKYKNGLVFLEGGCGGKITKLALGDKINQAQALYDWFVSEFGASFYLRYELGQERILFKHFPEDRFVLCQDVRFAKPESKNTLEILARIKGSTHELAQPPYPLLSFAELKSKFNGPQQVIETTRRLAANCNVKLPREQVLPPNPSGQSFEELVWEGARRRYGELNTKVKERLEYELQVIKDLGYADYFLIVADIVRFAKHAKIPVGPGRGSAASSLVAFVLGITEVDPLRWGLLFERFLNPERASKPDIDLDFCYERRSEVLNFVVHRFGSEHVAQIGTYGTFGPSSAANEIKRVLGKTNAVAAQEIQKLKRHRATHAAGLIITSQPIKEISAVYTDRDLPVTHLDMYALEDLGVLKIDLLGLRTLTLLHKMEEEVQKSAANFSLEQIPLYDQKTLDLLGQGKSLGIFQLESNLFQDLLIRLKPTSFEDIVALLALGRPGPLNMFPEFLARRQNPAKVRYLHPKLEEILGETYGLILYQEQVMAIANELGGLSLGEADLLRSALGKGDKQSIVKWRERFINGAQKRAGLKQSEATQIFQHIAKFSGYAFNKAHSVSYALITWRAAYLKANYPAQFFLTLLNQGTSGKERTSYLAEAQGIGLKIMGPSVVVSELGATLEGEALRLGLTTTRQITPHNAQQILKRRKGGGWSNFTQFRRSLNLDDKTLLSLVLQGALDDLGERNNYLQKLGQKPKSALELLNLERELLGIYASSHPCSPFLAFMDRLRGELDVQVGEILEIKVHGNLRQGVLHTPQGHLQFKVSSQVTWQTWAPKTRLALFGVQQDGYLDVSWALPLGPILLITPNPEDLEKIKNTLENQRGPKPAILLLGDAYHVLPPEFWVGDAANIGERLAKQEIVFTWFDPWKENVLGQGFFNV